jgi:hypothetical protein
MKIASNNIQSLLPNQVFVYGDNEAGIHGAGAAKIAYEKFGAKWGQYRFNGQAYGIPTKSAGFRVLTIPEIKLHVDTFLLFVKDRPDLEFLLTEVGCGFSGFKPEDIAPLFYEAINLPNLAFPQRFIDVLQNK